MPLFRRRVAPHSTSNELHALSENLHVAAHRHSWRQFYHDMYCRVGDELRNFSVITEPGKTHFSKTRKTYTGKIGGLQDDVAIAFQLCMIAMRTFFESPKYTNFSRQRV